MELPEEPLCLGVLLPEETLKMGLAYGFRGLVHCHHDREHGCRHADMVLKKYRVLHRDVKAAAREKASGTGLDF